MVGSKKIYFLSIVVEEIGLVWNIPGCDAIEIQVISLVCRFENMGWSRLSSTDVGKVLIVKM